MESTSNKTPAGPCRIFCGRIVRVLLRSCQLILLLLLLYLLVVLVGLIPVNNDFEPTADLNQPYNGFDIMALQRAGQAAKHLLNTPADVVARDVLEERFLSEDAKKILRTGKDEDKRIVHEGFVKEHQAEIEADLPQAAFAGLAQARSVLR